MLMEIQCTMPVKAVASSCPTFVLLPCFFHFSSEYLELPNVKINNLFSPDASFKYRNIISDVLKKGTHSHASHKTRGHCSILLLHVVTSLIMGGRYTRYRDWPLALLGPLPFDRHLRVTYMPYRPQRSSVRPGYREATDRPQDTALRGRSYAEGGA